MRRVCVLTCALVALGATGASAQDFRGAIAGRISDISGGRLPGVTVTATNTATNVASTAATNTDGDFSIPFLNPGTYAVTAELSGFKKVVREGVDLRTGDVLAVDVALQVGNVTESVEVTGAAWADSEPLTNRRASMPNSSKTLAIAKRAALELSESKTVSTRSRSTPPSMSPLT